MRQQLRECFQPAGRGSNADNRKGVPRRRGSGGARVTRQSLAWLASCLVDRGWCRRWRTSLTGRRAGRTRRFFPRHAYSPATSPANPMTPAASAEVMTARSGNVKVWVAPIKMHVRAPRGYPRPARMRNLGAYARGGRPDRHFWATVTARPRHAVQFWRLWITVNMWIRSAIKDGRAPPAGVDHHRTPAPPPGEASHSTQVGGDHTAAISALLEAPARSAPWKALERPGEGRGRAQSPERLE